MKISRLSKAEISRLRAILGRQPLENYELLWVLDGCLDSPGGTVVGAGSCPWPAGILVRQRDCFWLRLNNELLLKDMLGAFPRPDVYRIYTTDNESLEMLQRWLPDGDTRQSVLAVRNVTKTWRKRFEVSPRQVPPLNGVDQHRYILETEQGQKIASLTVRNLVENFQEITDHEFHVEGQHSYWLEEVAGAMVNHFMTLEQPVTMRLADENLLQLLEPLGFRQFSPLYYYVGIME